MQEKPELAASVRKKLGEIRQCWAELESTTQSKARQLFEDSEEECGQRIVRSAGGC